MRNIEIVINLKVEERRGGERRSGDNDGDGGDDDGDGNGDFVGDSSVMKLLRVK